MYQYNPDLTSGIMVISAHNVLLDFIEGHKNLNDLTKAICIGRMEEILENWLLEFGLGWVASKNLICQFKTIDFQNKKFEYYQPMVFEDFIAGSLPLLYKIFDQATLVDQVLKMKSKNPIENQTARAILYKTYFGLELFQVMTKIYETITEIQTEDDEYAYMAESVMYNMWWNEVVNQERFVFEIQQKDGSMKRIETYIKPIIAVKPNRFFTISDCRLVDYSGYKEG